MEIKDIKAVYFVGAGGIGISAIARYFLKKGLTVAGYDKTPSELTHELEKEGMLIHYEENVELIPSSMQGCQEHAGHLHTCHPRHPSGACDTSSRMDSPSRNVLRYWAHSPHTQRTMRGRVPWQDIYIHHVRTHHARESYRLQRIPRRHFKELWNQLHSVRQERLCSH